MKYFNIKIFIILWCIACTLPVRSQNISIIPEPNSIEMGKGFFKLSHQTGVTTTVNELDDVATYLRQETLRLTGIPLLNGEPGQGIGTAEISLAIKPEFKSLGAYELTISSGKIKIDASDVSGAFNGVNSLLQLIANNHQQKETVAIPVLTIDDQPKYQWRGLMLDASRYFISKGKIKEILQWMAYYKLNRFHWHLTDEPGWRLEIKKFPKLALVGGIGNYNDPNAPSEFYTQEDIKEIIEYAAFRNIEVIPEIDMPGHATAANKAYPEYSGGGSEKHPEFTFDPGNPETYNYLESILREVNVLFPSRMIHLGGDEVSFGNQQWNTNKGVKALMAKHNLSSLKDVEHYFMETMANTVYNMNAKVLAWDELADANLPQDKTIMFWWRHDKPEQLNTALSNGFNTVVCPRIPYYFDFVQHESHHYGRRWAGEFSTLEKIYGFDVERLIDNKNNKDKILGVQANLWTETITTDERLEYMLFPRLAALAESAWTTNRTDYEGFQKRLEKHIALYNSFGVYHFNPFKPIRIPEPVYIRK